MSVQPILGWLGDTSFAGAVRETFYPYVRAMHVGGAGILFGNLLLLDLRILGRGRSVAIDRVRSLTLMLIWFGFALAVVGGTLLFLAQPQALWENGALRTKLVLIACAGVNALVFESVLPQGTAGRALRTSAALSLCIWTSVLVFSSLIPYWGL